MQLLARLAEGFFLGASDDIHVIQSAIELTCTTPITPSI